MLQKKLINKLILLGEGYFLTTNVGKMYTGEVKKFLLLLLIFFN